MLARFESYAVQPMEGRCAPWVGQENPTSFRQPPGPCPVVLATFFPKLPDLHDT